MASALPAPDRPSFSWSASRHDTFASCRRRYFYSYYGALEDEEIRRLKKLSALPLWAGSVVHDAIEAFLHEHDAVPAPEAQEALIRQTVHGTMVSAKTSLTSWKTTVDCHAALPLWPRMMPGMPGNVTPSASSSPGTVMWVG